MNAGALSLFDKDNRPAFDMVRSTDLDTAEHAAVRSLSSVQANRLLVLRLLFEHDWLTMFCPYPLMGEESQYRQTVIGPRFAKLRREELIVRVADRSPRHGAETTAIVSCFAMTPKGRDYLRANWVEVPK